MATKVYLSGDVVTVEKTGDPVLKIPQRVAKYIFITTSTTSEVPLDVPAPKTVRIINSTNTDKRVDTFENIQDQSGTPIGDFDAVNAYLSGFIFAAEGKTVIQTGQGIGI